MLILLAGEREKGDLRMRVAICSESTEEQHWMMELLQSCCTKLNVDAEFRLFQKRERFILSHGEHPFDLIIVAFEGANGQEAVLHAKRLYHNCQLIWASRDRMFALQGYRIGIESFLLKSIDPQLLTKNFCVCVQKYLG